MNKNIEDIRNIKIVKGDLFYSDKQTLVNTVNCKGVMGAGIAKTFKSRFPNMFNEYKELCRNKELTPGKLHLWKNSNNKWVLNFPTKDHWKKPSKKIWIEEGMQYLINNYKDWGIKSIAFPALGCSLGGLSWVEVKDIMINYLSQLDIEVEIFQPEISNAEKAIVLIKGEINNKYSNSIKELNIYRSLKSTEEDWTDWKNAEQLHFMIYSSDDLEGSFFESLSQTVLKKHKVRITFTQCKSLTFINTLDNKNANEEQQSLIFEG
jgi:O-acetyl-ADP-ribose deacetylase (regulator of RNase III)